MPEDEFQWDYSGRAYRGKCAGRGVRDASEFGRTWIQGRNSLLGDVFNCDARRLYNENWDGCRDLWKKYYRRRKLFRLIDRPIVPPNPEQLEYERRRREQEQAEADRFNRAQQKRANLWLFYGQGLLRALEQGEITRDDKVLVVGAGAAGAVATMTCASCGLDTVIIDRKSRAFLRQAGCGTRWIESDAVRLAGGSMVSGENLFPLLFGAVAMGRGPVIPDRRSVETRFFRSAKLPPEILSQDTR